MDSIVAEKTWQQKMWLAYHTISACPEVERPHEAGPESKVSKLGPLWRNSSSKAPPLKCSVTVPNIPSSWESNVQTHTMRDMLLSQHDTHFDCSGTQLGCLVILQNPEFPYTIPWQLATSFQTDRQTECLSLGWKCTVCIYGKLVPSLASPWNIGAENLNVFWPWNSEHSRNH